MTNTSKYVLIGVGVLALLGIGVFAMASTRRRQELPPIQSNVPQQSSASIVDVADKVITSIKGNGEAAQQRIANRRVRQSTRQAKLLKKGKIRIEDLEALQKV
jgi:hypothetical protein